MVKDKYRRAKAWCPGCDRSLVAIGKKCLVCGKRFEKNPIPKPNLTELRKIAEDDATSTLEGPVSGRS